MQQSTWMMARDPAGDGRAIAAAAGCRMDFIAIALLPPEKVNAARSRCAPDRAGRPAVCLAGLPGGVRVPPDPEGAKPCLRPAPDPAAATGAPPLAGVTNGGIGEGTGVPPGQAECDNVARAVADAAVHPECPDPAFGIDPANRHESRILASGRHAVGMIKRAGAGNIFGRLGTYRMTIGGRGRVPGILEAAGHPRCIHLAASGRVTPRPGTVRRDKVFAVLKAAGLKCGLAIWRPVAASRDVARGQGLPFLRTRAWNTG
ncbi:MAG: sugar phosphate isomerase/epimerase [Rhodobacter sp.]|nr:sugar phosphate isomerase/epimerase [Rhodobacter sp.]